MEEIYNQYICAKVVPAEMIHALELQIPMIDVNEIINGIGKREIEKLLHLIPATTLSIDISDTWDGEQDTLSGLMAGKYLKKIFIANCDHDIKFLPPSTEEIIIRATRNCHPIRLLVNMENIKKITLMGGCIDARTWTAIGDRHTDLESLELIATTIENCGNATQAMGKIINLETKKVYVRGTECSHDEFIKKIYDKYY